MEASPIFYLAITTLAFGVIIGITELWSLRGDLAEARIREPERGGRRS